MRPAGCRRFTAARSLSDVDGDRRAQPFDRAVEIVAHLQRQPVLARGQLHLDDVLAVTEMHPRRRARDGRTRRQAIGVDADVVMAERRPRFGRACPAAPPRSGNSRRRTPGAPGSARWRRLPATRRTLGDPPAPIARTPRMSAPWRRGWRSASSWMSAWCRECITGKSGADAVAGKMTGHAQISLRRRVARPGARRHR